MILMCRSSYNYPTAPMPSPLYPLSIPPRSSSRPSSRPSSRSSSHSYSSGRNSFISGGHVSSFGINTSHSFRKKQSFTPPRQQCPSPHYSSLHSFVLPKPIVNDVPILKGSYQYSQIKTEVETANTFLEKGFYEEACRRLRKLTESHPLCYVSWLEYSRMEHIRGNAKTACDALERGLQYLPTNESLLEKKMRLDERLRSVSGVTRCCLQLISTNTPRGIHKGVAGIITIAKMGEISYALSLFEEFVNSDYHFEVSYYLDFVRFLFKAHSYDYGNEHLTRIAKEHPEYSPVWFFMLQMKEQYYCLRWNDMKSSELIPFIQGFLENAIPHVSNDLVWKMCCNAAQSVLRLYTQYRKYKRYHPLVPEDMKVSILETSHILYSNCLLLIHEGLKRCGEHYTWKIWIMLAKICNAFGYQTFSKQVSDDSYLLLIVCRAFIRIPS